MYSEGKNRQIGNRCESKGKGKNDSKLLGLSTWKDEVTTTERLQVRCKCEGGDLLISERLTFERPIICQGGQRICEPEAQKTDLG